MNLLILVLVSCCYSVEYDNVELSNLEETSHALVAYLVKSVNEIKAENMALKAEIDLLKAAQNAVRDDNNNNNNVSYLQ